MSFVLFRWTMRPANLHAYYSAYLEGDLDEGSRRRFEEILDQRPDLRRDYELFARTNELITRQTSEAADADFEQRVLSRLNDPKDGKTRGIFSIPLPPWKPLAASAAAVLLLGLGVLSVMSRLGGDNPEPSIAGDTTSPASGRVADGRRGSGPATAESARPGRPSTGQAPGAFRIADSGLPGEAIPLRVGDDQVASQLQEITALIAEINTLKEDFYNRDEGIVLEASSDQELVFQPSTFYRMAVQAAKQPASAGDDVRHAY